MKSVKILLFVSMCIMISSGTVAADALIAPVAAESVNHQLDRTAWKAVNGAGLTGSTHNTTPSDMWADFVTGGGVGPAPPADGPGLNGAWFAVDLGGWYSVSQVEVWNYNEGCCLTVGAEAVEIDFWNGAGWDSTGSMAIPEATGSATEPGNTFAVSQPAARYARVKIDNANNDWYSGLAEVQFTGAPAADPGGGSPWIKVDKSEISVTASSEGTAGRFAAETIDEVGLILTDAYTSFPEHMWMTDPGETTGHIQYEFDVAKDLAEIMIWNYNEGNGHSQGVFPTDRGAKRIQIEWSADGLFFNDVGGEVVLPQGTGNFRPVDATTIDLSSIPGLAQVVRINILENYGNATNVGLSEVRFMEVPEPCTTALMGLGALGLIKRRRA